MVKTTAHDPRAATVQALGAALDGGDLDAFEDLLAGDVQWFGAHGGACHSRDQVLAVLREQGVMARSVDPLLVGDRVLLHIERSPGQHAAGDDDPIPWLVVATLDPAGRIIHMQDYMEAASARRDLTLRAQSAPAADGLPPARRVSSLVPFIHVTDVKRSADFYRLLGFDVRDTYQHGDHLNWAWLQSHDAALMLARGEEPVDAREEAVLFYLYARDLAPLRDHLVTQGVLAGEILDGTPGPRHEMRVIDPDGYCLMIAQIED